MLVCELTLGVLWRIGVGPPLEFLMEMAQGHCIHDNDGTSSHNRTHEDAISHDKISGNIDDICLSGG